MIYFYCTDNNEPTGGILTTYRQVDVLNANGFEAAILHHEPGFRATWFKNDTRIEYMEQAEGSADDIMVVANVLERYLDTTFVGMPKVIFNQGCYMTFVEYPLGYIGEYHYKDALATIVVSEDSKRYLEYVFPDCPVFRVTHGIDPALFYYDPSKKKDQVAFMVRKCTEHTKQVICILRARGIKYPFVPIQDATHEEVAQILRESRFFVNFDHSEGFGLPAAEAMASGCCVIGYHGMGGKEFLRQPYAHPIEFSDIIAYASTIELLLDTDVSEQARKASEMIHTDYSLEVERQSIVDCWTRILALQASQPD